MKYEHAQEAAFDLSAVRLCGRVPSKPSLTRLPSTLKVASSLVQAPELEFLAPAAHCCVSGVLVAGSRLELPLWDL